MDVRILDLDGAITTQKALVGGRPVCNAREWGPRIRMACGFGQFRRFEQDLSDMLGAEADDEPHLTFYGSGDFHHVSLALLRRLREPFNLLVLDNHPDWMRGVPFLHCGTWLRHASLLPMARRIFHVGGEVDFDNSYRWMAPWRELRESRITPFPAYRRFHRGAWAGVEHEPLRPSPSKHANRTRVEELLRPYREELADRPLYISLDKDVLAANEAVVNWDSGLLAMNEVNAVLDGFTTAAYGRLAGMDVVGDWSPVNVQGWFRKMFHLTEHPALHIDPDYANHVNQCINLRLLAERGGVPTSRSLQGVG